MLTHPSYPSVNQYTEKQNKAVHRIFESLEKGEERLGSHYEASRAHARRRCHSVVQITAESLEGEKVTFNAYMGDISPSGMSFIFPNEVPGPDIIVGIPLGDTNKTLFKGVIVRVKAFPGEDFIEYGVKFAGRIV